LHREWEKVNCATPEPRRKSVAAGFSVLFCPGGGLFPLMGKGKEKLKEESLSPSDGLAFVLRGGRKKLTLIVDRREEATNGEQRLKVVSRVVRVV